jgi:DNA-binding GntR family transcriptional regulator
MSIQSLPGLAPSSKDWEVPRPRTLADHASEVILSAASRGLLIPGDRLVEKDLCQMLDISRVPLREALRSLESQGIVTSEPYRGIRLMSVSKEKLDQILDVRAVLESLAARRAIEAKRNDAAGVARLDQAVDGLRIMGERGDVYGFAKADTEFHRTLCALAGNPVLSAQWESLARQLTIIFGLSTLGKPINTIVYEHRLLVEVFQAGDLDAVEKAVREHILVQPRDVDFDKVIAERRLALQNRP